MKRKELLNLYKTVIEIDPKTGKERRKAVYIGKHYHFDMAVKKKRLPLWWLLYLLSLAAFITPGCMVSSMMSAFYVLVPYMLCMLPILYTLIAMIGISSMKDPATDVNVNDGPGSAGRMLIGASVLGVIWFVCDLVFAVIGDFSVTVGSNIVCIVCAAAFGALSFLLRREIMKLELTEIPEEKSEAEHVGE